MHKHSDPALSSGPFSDFYIEDIQTTGATIRSLRKGSGPPLLLLHGYPQTHFIWHKIASRLADHYTVILTDLRGYGDSSKPASGDRHVNYSFRTMAQDQIQVMRKLGYDRFYVGAHDRGARVAHRMCLDHPNAVMRACLLDIVPTLTVYRETNRELATTFMWWFFLIQKEPLPEHMIGADAEFFLQKHLEGQTGTPGALTEEAIAEYRRCFCRPDAIHASCEDYRAAATIDLDTDIEDEKAGRKIVAPLLTLWGAKGAVGKFWDVVEVWRKYAENSVEGRALNGGHYLAEEQPEEVLQEMQRFFTA